MFVSHDPLDHVGRNLVVHEPGGVGVAQAMEPQRLPGVADDVPDGLGAGVEGRSNRIAGVEGPSGAEAVEFAGAGIDLRWVEFGDRAEESGADEGGPPDTGSEQGAAQRRTHLVGEDEPGTAGAVVGDVAPQDRKQPVREWDGAPSGAAFGVELERGLPVDLDHGTDDLDGLAVEVKGIGRVR